MKARLIQHLFKLLLTLCVAALFAACSPASSPRGSGGGSGSDDVNTTTTSTDGFDVGTGTSDSTDAATGTVDTGTGDTGPTGATDTTGTTTGATTGTTTGATTDTTGPDCEPQCDFKDCGPDNCGGSCGECGPGEVCAAEGYCEAQGGTTGGTGDDGACTNAADQAIVDSMDVEGTAKDCALANLGNEPAALACIKEKTGLSESCIVCFSGIVTCGIEKCISQCLIDSASPECNQCLEDNCYPAFNECSGLNAGG